MAWDIVREEKHPCPCGKSTYTETLAMDDWNRSETRREMDCPDCKLNYRLDRKTVFHSGDWDDVLSWVRIDKSGSEE